MIKKILRSILILIVVGMIFCFGIVVYIKRSTAHQLVENMEDINKEIFSTALILGASVRDGEPSPMLRDRLDAGIALYRAGKVRRLMMSGDGRSPYYNEVRVMRRYALVQGVEAADIMVDPEGVSTFESIRRLKDAFALDNVIIVSQQFHLPRALYIANRLGIVAIAYPAEDIPYDDLSYLYLRDSAASVKEFFKLLTGW
ncbi:MAG: ElyC/SanA/YdcF family protein [Eubacteriales bacterium]|nr:ElyC/SanA/YdcF family protein [Eubacteriales bacterium]